jgi:hypothetical protein
MKKKKYQKFDLTDQKKIELIEKWGQKNKFIFYFDVISINDITDELLSLEIPEDVINWIKNSSCETIYEIVKSNCDSDYLNDLGNWDRIQNILDYIGFDEADFIEEVELIIVQKNRDDVIGSLLN